MRALKLCHLKSTVSALPGGLDHEVEDGGANFSLGQRQLLAMTRALLRQSRIVILDEASAALDLHSDVQMRQVVKEQFCDRGATVLVIAHRLRNPVHCKQLFLSFRHLFLFLLFRVFVPSKEQRLVSIRAT